MIATFDPRSRGVRRWSAAGLVLSISLAAVSLTGAVRGQDAKPEADKRPAPPAAAASAAAAAPAPRPAAKGEAPHRFTRADAEKLWRDKYAPLVIFVNGREANREQVDRQYVEEVCGVVGSEQAGLAMLGLRRTPDGRLETAPPGPARLTPEEAAKLWNEKILPDLVVVNERVVNQEAMIERFVDEVEWLTGSRAAGFKARDDITFDVRGKASVAPAARSPRKPMTPEDAAALWNDKYRDQVILVNGRPANQQPLLDAFRDALEQVTGNAVLANRLRDSLNFDATFKATPKPAREATPVASSDAPDGAETPEERAMAQTLARRVPEVKFEAAPLSDVLDRLRDAADADVFVDWKALEAAGVDRNSPVTLRARNVPFSQALVMALESVGAGTPLGYSLKGGVVRVSTGEEIEKDTEVRAYDVRDLVPGEIDMKELVGLITDTVSPESWRDAGGNSGSVHTSKHKLVITATEPNHREIRDILRMLRDGPRDAAPAGH